MRSRHEAVSARLSGRWTTSRGAVLARAQSPGLTIPGRGPTEAEALMQWMKENEDAWRAWGLQEAMPGRGTAGTAASGLGRSR